MENQWQIEHGLRSFMKAVTLTKTMTTHAHGKFQNSLQKQSLGHFSVSNYISGKGGA